MIKLKNLIKEWKKYSVSGDDISTMKSDYFQHEPWRGPHESAELTLMLKGEKPAAMIADFRYDAEFSEHVKDGKFKSQRISNGSFVVTQPEESWRIKRIDSLYKNKVYIKSRAKFHAMLGILLGYSKSDIRKFIDVDFQPGNLNELMSFNQLVQSSEDGRIKRAGEVRNRSLPVSTENNMESWNFRYKSNPSTTGKPYRGSIKFLKEVKPSTNAADMQCKVDCECPDFKFRFAYNDAKQGASDIGSKTLNKAINRSPQPAYDQGVGLCKHLISLGSYLKTKITTSKRSNLFETMDDIVKQPSFTVEYSD